eukprot:3014947-Prymnesium_polylepis.1
MGRWRWYWSQGRKSAEGRRERGSLGLASMKAVAGLLRDAREVGALAGGAGCGDVGGEGEGEVEVVLANK